MGASVHGMVIMAPAEETYGSRVSHDTLFRSQDALLSLLAAGTPSRAAFLVDDEGLIMYWNASTQRLWGHPSDAVLHRVNLHALWQPNARSGGLQRCDLPALSKMAGLGPVRGRLQHADGHKVAAELQIHALLPQPGEPRLWAVLAQRTSYRRTVGHPLRPLRTRLQSSALPQPPPDSPQPHSGHEECLRLALAAAHMGTYEWCARHQQLRWSEQTARLHGITLSEFQSTIDHARALTHPDDLEPVLAQIGARTCVGEDFAVEYRAVHPHTGDIRWLYAYGRAIAYEGTMPSRIIGIVMDITQQKDNERRLKEVADTWRTLSSVGHALSGELHLDTLLQAVTDAATKLTHARVGAFFYTGTDSQGDTFTLCTVSGASRADFARFPLPRTTGIFAPTLTEGRAVRSADITRDPHYGRNAPYHGMPAGHPVVTSYLAVPVIARTGEVLGGLFFGHPKPGVFTDLDEAVAVSLAAQAAVAIDNARLFTEAQESMQQRDTFLTLASHELKTPLTPLKIQMQRLLRLLEHPCATELSRARLQRLGLTCCRQVERLSRLVDDILTTVESRDEGLTLRREAVDLEALARQVLAQYQATIDAAGCTVQLEAEPDLPIGQWDRLRIRQVMISLLMNAVKYGPSSPVRITLTHDSQEVVLGVHDQGVGIATGDRERIFAIMARGQTALNIGGLGLGLSSSKQIVEAHGGHIQVRSTIGQGSSFLVHLPLQVAADTS